MGKARTLPLYQITKELMAAVVSTRVAKLLETELSFDSCMHYHYTDSSHSTVVLGYINNDAKRFQVFVAN